jgi:poly-gamma-glutamate synthesis protein (capsule biosynthesis protein)
MPTIAFIGDVMLGRGVNADLRRRSPEEPWGTTLPILRGADAVIANLECAVTTHPTSWARSFKVFHFRADPAMVAVLRAANIRCVSLANNHTLDQEVEGLLDTLRHLDAAGIARAGAGRNQAEAAAPATLEVAGLRIAVLAATDNEPGFAAGKDRPGTHYLKIGRDPEALNRLAALAAGARQSGAQVVVLSLHWGPNMVTEPPPHFQRFARAALEFADLVYGHSAHVFQGVQQNRGRLILYDTGDFLDDYAVDPVLHNDRSLIFLVDFTPGGAIERLRMLPVVLGYARVDRAVGREFEDICSDMAARAGALGTALIRTPEGLELAISP